MGLEFELWGIHIGPSRPDLEEIKDMQTLHKFYCVGAQFGRLTQFQLVYSMLTKTSGVPDL